MVVAPLPSAGVTRMPMDATALRFIVRELRERDRREIFALRPDNDEDAFIADVMVGAGNDTWSIWWADGVPVATNGATPIRRGAFQLGCFGTEDWPKVVRDLSRDALDRVLPMMIDGGGHRAEAWALAENTDSRRFIERLGGEQEGYLREFGRDREDFVIYGWRLEHVYRRQQKLRDAAAGIPSTVGP